ncbi:DUF4383 domain-containing protein [Cellulomonas sp. B6]|jgi:uncharacterized membrane protein YuzA (DUF378 family)|uniref:DUF4383 domain-containing protein n=1 Tax=Cellulomonas sp. B6 TaxID=1295626 RepID=UPI00073B6B7A|nr:DUF4383 domain-containing protein [Cellulomonas sp. B6]KSW20714.1 hypothetical protein ATM99_15430 [Cellulomonas sp. B6]
MTSSPNRLVATVFGAVYLLVGLAGFLVTGGLPFAGQQGNALVVFDVNPLHNVVHLGIGLALLLASRSVAGARATTTTIGAVYLLVGVLGLFLIGSGANILALNGADNVLHLASAVLLLAVGLGADKAPAARTATA